MHAAPLAHAEPYHSTCSCDIEHHPGTHRILRGRLCVGVGRALSATPTLLLPYPLIPVDFSWSNLLLDRFGTKKKVLTKEQIQEHPLFRRCS